MISVQDDSGSVEDAVAYVDADYFIAYHEARGVEIEWSVPEIEAALIRGTDYLDRRWRWRGERRNVRQRTAWPRSGVVDDDELARDGVPFEVKEASAEYAVSALRGELDPEPVRHETGALIQSQSQAVGPISESVTFVSGAGFASPKIPKADRKLRGLVESGGELVRG